MTTPTRRTCWIQPNAPIHESQRAAEAAARVVNQRNRGRRQRLVAVRCACGAHWTLTRGARRRRH